MGTTFGMVTVMLDKCVLILTLSLGYFTLTAVLDGHPTARHDLTEPSNRGIINMINILMEYSSDKERVQICGNEILFFFEVSIAYINIIMYYILYVKMTIYGHQSVSLCHWFKYT